MTPWDWTTTVLDVTAATPVTDPGANDTTVLDADLLHMVESKRCLDSGRVLLRKFDRVVVGLN